MKEKPKCALCKDTGTTVIYTHGNNHPCDCAAGVPVWKGLTPEQEDEMFECVECFCNKERHGGPMYMGSSLQCGYDLTCDEFDYYKANPERYEAMRQRWPQYEFHKWDYARWLQEHS